MQKTNIKICRSIGGGKDRCKNILHSQILNSINYFIFQQIHRARHSISAKIKPNSHSFCAIIFISLQLITTRNTEINNTRVHANGKKNMPVSGWVCVVHQHLLFLKLISAYVLNLTSVVPIIVWTVNIIFSWKYKKSQFNIAIMTTMMMLIILTKKATGLVCAIKNATK